MHSNEKLGPEVNLEPNNWPSIQGPNFLKRLHLFHEDLPFQQQAAHKLYGQRSFTCKPSPLLNHILPWSVTEVPIHNGNVAGLSILYTSCWSISLYSSSQHGHRTQVELWLIRPEHHSIETLCQVYVTTLYLHTTGNKSLILKLKSCPK